MLIDNSLLISSANACDGSLPRWMCQILDLKSQQYSCIGTQSFGELDKLKPSSTQKSAFIEVCFPGKVLQATVLKCWYKRGVGGTGLHFSIKKKKKSDDIYSRANMKTINCLLLLPVSRFPGKHGGLSQCQPIVVTSHILRSISQAAMLCQPQNNHLRRWQKKKNPNKT